MHRFKKKKAQNRIKFLRIIHLPSFNTKKVRQ